MAAVVDNDNHDLSYDHGIFNDSALNVQVTASPMYKPLVGMSTDLKSSVGSKRQSSLGFKTPGSLKNSNSFKSSKLAKVAKDGKYLFPDGAMFSGYLVDGSPHGYGVTRYVDGITFIGFYLKKKREGEGELYYPNGRILYRGGFVDDKREGYGVFYWGNGCKYKGEWKDGQMDGEGEEYSPDARLVKNESLQYKGSYKKGKREGYGIYYYENGSIYRGEWKAGLKHGQGEFHNTRGKLQYEGGYSKGLRSGYGRYFYDDGSKYIGGWKDGVRSGHGEEFDPQGQLLFTGTFEKDERKASSTPEKKAIEENTMFNKPKESLTSSVSKLKTIIDQMRIRDPKYSIKYLTKSLTQVSAATIKQNKDEDSRQNQSIDATTLVVISARAEKPNLFKSGLREIKAYGETATSLGQSATKRSLRKLGSSLKSLFE